MGGSGEDFGTVWGGSGSLLGAVGRSQGCCMLFFVIFLYFGYFWRRCRAERRERSERCEAPGRLFAVFRYFLLFLVISDCFVIVWAVFGCPANFQIFCLSFACFYYSHMSSRFPFLAKAGYIINAYSRSSSRSSSSSNSSPSSSRDILAIFLKMFGPI